MAIDFDRSSSSKIVASSIPLGTRPVMMECWFKCDGWSDIGVSYGYLMGIFSTVYSLEMALRIKRDTSASPVYRLEFVVTNLSGTFISYTNLSSLPSGWTHALGYWSTSGSGLIRLVKDGVGAATNNSTGLFLFANAYDFGWSPVAASHYFDGQLAEWAVWDHPISSGSGEKVALAAYKGWNPDDRDPFYYVGTQKLKSWVPGFNTSVYDIMRPAVTWTETNVSTVEDHPPVFAAAKNVTHPAAVTAPAPPAERIVHIGGLVGKSTRIRLAG